VRPGLVRKRRAAKVALTFDDGPSQWTHPILDLLADHDARATFFAVGANIPGNAGVVERAHAEGHLLGNHTTNHPDLTQLTLAEAARELAETTLMLDAATGGTTVYWRAPYLRRPRVLSTPGLIHIGCDVVPEDWMEPDADVICNRVLASSAIDPSSCCTMGGRPASRRMPRADLWIRGIRRSQRWHNSYRRCSSAASSS